MRGTDLTIAQGLAALDKREISAVELTQAHLAGIAALNPRLNAYITVAG